MNLVSKRKALQKQVDTLDKATTKEQQRQIELINEDIAELTREADKELAESTREYDRLKAEGEITTDFISWRTRSTLEEGVKEVAKEQAEKQQAVEQSPAEEITEAVAQVEQESREKMEKRAKKELIKEEKQRRARERKQFKGQKIKGQRRKRYVPTKDEINSKVEEYIQEQEAQQEAQLLAQQIEKDDRKKPTEQVAEQPTQEVTEQTQLDQQWNNELPEIKEELLETAEKELKEEKGPGRRRMLIGRRKAPVITQEEILQRAKEILNTQRLSPTTSTQEQEVSPTTPDEGPQFRTKEKGEVVYHGSPTKIEGGKIKKGTSEAIFLTPQREYAEVYTGTQGQGEITETTITEDKKSKLFDLRNKEHVERLKQGFLNNNEELEIEYDSQEAALRDYENAIRSMNSAAENRDGVNDWASGGRGS